MRVPERLLVVPGVVVDQRQLDVIRLDHVEWQKAGHAVPSIIQSTLQRTLYP